MLACLGLPLPIAARGQSLTVAPVTISLAPGQMATTLMVTNDGAAEISVQLRALAWRQDNGSDVLSPTDEVMASPPIATLASGASQVVRLVLRHPPKTQEATYRMLLDQIPPVAAAGTVQMALRLSIPVFAQPPTRAVPHLTYEVRMSGAGAYLVGSNVGARHEKLFDLALATAAGVPLKLVGAGSPYMLAGTTTRRRIAAAVSPGSILHLTGHADAGAVDRPVVVVAEP